MLCLITLRRRSVSGDGYLSAFPASPDPGVRTPAEAQFLDDRRNSTSQRIFTGPPVQFQFRLQNTRASLLRTYVGKRRSFYAQNYGARRFPKRKTMFVVKGKRGGEIRGGFAEEKSTRKIRVVRHVFVKKYFRKETRLSSQK